MSFTLPIRANSPQPKERNLPKQTENFSPRLEATTAMQREMDLYYGLMQLGEKLVLTNQPLYQQWEKVKRAKLLYAQWLLRHKDLAETQKKEEGIKLLRSLQEEEEKLYLLIRGYRDFFVGEENIRKIMEQQKTK